MKIFKFKSGDFEQYGVYRDLQEAYDRRTEIEQSYDFLPVTIEEFTIPYYNITLSATEDLPFVPDEAEEIREALRAAGVQFHSQLGLKRLRELADEHLLSDPKIDTEAPPEE